MSEMSTEDYLCTFELDYSFSKLCDRLQKYYDDTPDSMGNKEAAKCWKEFRQWCESRGYTQIEINKAKTARKQE